LGDSLGRYQLIVSIGHGGMGEVFLGRLRGVAGFAKLVVIKRMHSHLSHDKRFIELFVNEGRVVAQLSHPNICQVHELGEQDGDLFLVMEYLSGVSWEELSRNLPRGTALEIPLIVGVLAQACEGLHYAHQLHDHAGQPTPVVHRDVSPQNLFVTTDGICKVLDFGVAKISTSERYSQSGLVKGKLPYMAPEQIRGQPVDGRTDVFAMGVVLWEAFAGSRLFSRPTDFLIWKAITEEPIPPLLQLRPDLPPGVEAIVGRALQRSPARRYPTILALAQDLRKLAPAPLDNNDIAAALRSTCAVKLAESAAAVAAGLREIDLPERERAAPATEADAAETLHSAVLPSVMLREASYRKVMAPARRARWPYVAVVLALAAAAAGALGWLRREPRGGLASAPPASAAPVGAVIDA
jgi:eukaryotic-like serine/threonine-protein kinase